jgi:hypothetical protein
LATTSFVAQPNAGFFQLSSVEFGQIHCLIVVVEGEDISILLGIVRCLVFFAFSVSVCGLAMSPLGTNRTTCDVRNSVAIEGKADITRGAVSVAINPRRTSP